MNQDSNDDQIIAIAFKRSLIVLLVSAILIGIWVLSTNQQHKAPKIEASEISAPRPVNDLHKIQPPVVLFTDITHSSGITHSHHNGAYGERLLPETMGGGVAVFDFNNDQAIDLLFINGQSWPWKNAQSKNSSLVLYQGDGQGNFVDVTEKIRLDTHLYGMGSAIGDFDGDGNDDVFVTTVGKNRLYRNVGGQRFEDVTTAAGVGGGDDWSTGAAFLDYDNDGDLDLMVLNYVRWSREIDLQADYQLTGIGRAYGPPAQFAGTNSYLYRNDGDGSFTDVSLNSGIQVSNPSTGLPMGKGLSLLPSDIDGDGWVDIVVANDMVRNFLFHNKKGAGFEEIGIQSGIAFDNTGLATGAMGIDGDVLGVSKEHAIAIGNFGNEMTSLYVRPQDSTLFTDQAVVTGIGPASRRAVTFGLFFFDYDLDGRLDLLQANGHIEPDINVVEPGQTYAQLPQLFWNCGEECARQFIQVSLSDDSGLSAPLVGRGAAYADIDRDGDLDVILTQIGNSPKVLRNDQTTGHNWIQFDVLDSAGAPAIGAEIELLSGKQKQYRRLMPTRSYLSQVEPSISFGIGNVTSVEIVKITWPSGKTLTLENPSINQRHLVKQPR